MKVLFQSSLCAACLSLALVAGGAANAQTKVSLEQAWGECLKAANKAAGPKVEENDSARTAAFKACMTKMGHAEGK